MQGSSPGLIFRVMLVSCGLAGFPVAATASSYFSRALTGDYYSYGNAVGTTTDGGYIVAGAVTTAGGTYGWLAKLDGGGNTSWVREYGGGIGDHFNAVVQNPDGSFVCAGATGSSGAGSVDFWIVKVGADGGLIWERVYGGAGSDEVFSMQRTSDGGIVLFGDTLGWVSSPQQDPWLMKVDSNGVKQWELRYSGQTPGVGTAVRQTTDGGYILLGGLYSPDRVLVIKVGATGAIVFERIYEMAGLAGCWGILEMPDHGFFLAGATLNASLNGWCMRLNSSGGIVWQKIYGSSATDYLVAATSTTDGNIVVVGYTVSYGAGSHDGWLMKLGPNGNVIWSRTVGGGKQDYLSAVAPTSDGGVIAIGTEDGLGASGSGGLVVRCSSAGEIDSSCGALWQSQSVGSADTAAIANASNLSVSYLVPDSATGTGNTSQPSSSNYLLCGSPCAPIAASPPALPGGVVGSLYDQTIAASGGTPPYSYAISGGSPPPELLLDSATGRLSGTPGTPGSYSFMVTAIDAVGCTGSREYILEVSTTCSPPHITTQPVSATVTAGTQVLLSVGVSGTAPLNCQWYVGASGDTSNPVPGANSIVYQTPPITSTTSYWVRVENACGYENSLAATLTAGSVPVITSVKSKTAKPGSLATLYGSGFSTTLKNNTVYFGTKKAKISKAKSTSLKVIIPKKAPKGNLGVYVVVSGKASNVVQFLVK